MYESGSRVRLGELGSDIFHHTRMSGLRTFHVHFSIQNEFIEAGCSSGHNTSAPNSAQFFPKLCPDTVHFFPNKTQVIIMDFLYRELHE
jgi:hypothetical protein